MKGISSVYLETTIPSYLASRPSGNLVVAGEQLLTREWWDSRRCQFDLYVSELVVEEAGAGNPERAQERLGLISNVKLLTIDDATMQLAQALVGSGLIPTKATADATHVAIASRYEIDFLLTWNCTHIANAQILRGLSTVVQKNGYTLPVVCTPIELMGGVTND